MESMFDAAPDLFAPPLQQSTAFENALRCIGQLPLRDTDGRLVLRRRFGPFQVNMLTRARMTEAPNDLEGAVILAPDHPVSNLRALPLVSPATVAEFDLTPSEEILRKNLHGKWRNRLRHAQSHGLRVARQNLPTQLDHWLLKAEETQQKQHRYRHWPAALTCAYASANKGEAKLFTAFYGSDAVAGLLLRHGPTATYHIGHTSTAGRIVSAQNLLMWAAICWAKSKGVARLDLGVIDTETSPGLARFKLGTGAQTRKLGGTWLWHPRLRFLNGLRHMDARMMR